jgi:DNA-binding SARP family transcriptional activator/tetratricopeptide (TPR) repeat protein
VEFRVLGPMEIRRAGSPVTGLRRHERLVLAVLLLESGRVVAADRLIRLLWDTRPPARARSVLQTYVSRLRRVLATGDGAPAGDRGPPGSGAATAGTGGPAVVARRGDGYALLVDPLSVDAHRYRTLVDRALALPDPAARARLLCDAESLWRGPPLSGLVDEPVRAELTARLEALHRHAAKERYTAELALGRHEQVAAELADVTGRSPLDEALVGLLMQALYRCGRRGEALEVYWRTRRRLAAELGIDPGDELNRLYTAMLRGDRSLVTAPVGAPPATAPGPPGTPPAGPAPAASVRLAWTTAGETDGTAAPDPPGTPGCDRTQQLPAALTDFVGRSRELAEIRRVATAGTGVAVVAIAGLPGVGKTSLAVRAAHELRDRFGGPALYLDLGGEANPVPPGEALARLLRALGVPDLRIPADPSERAGLLRAILSGRAAVLVLDNAASAAQVRPLIPGDRAVVLVTSRRTLVDLDGAHRLQLRQMATPEAVALLGNVIGHDRVAGDPAAAAELVGHCGGLPLAVRIVAAQLVSRPQWSLRQAAGWLARLTTRLDHLTRSDRSVRAVFAATYQPLPDAARRLLRGLALHDLVDAPAWMAAAILDSGAAVGEEALAALVEANLVEVHRTDAADRYRYRPHNLVRAFAYERALAEETSAARRELLVRTFTAWLAMAERADAALEGAPYPCAPVVAPQVVRRVPAVVRPVVDPHAWFQTEMPNLRALIAQARRTRHLRAFAWALAWSCDYALRVAGRYGELRDCCLDGLAAAQAAGDAHGQACMHLCLAFVHMGFNDLEAGRRHVEAARALAAGTGDRWIQGEIDLALAGLLDDAGDLRAERAALERAVRRFTAVGDLASAGACLTRLGSVAAWQGDPAATGAVERGVALLRVRGAGRRLATGLYRLGQVHALGGRHDRARAVYREALELVRRHRDRVGELAVHAVLSACLAREGELQRAERHLADAERLAADVDLPRFHCYVLHARGRLRHARGDLVAARDDLTTCLDLGPLPAVRLAVLSDLAEVCRDLGDQAAARRYLRRALATADRMGAAAVAEAIRASLG